MPRQGKTEPFSIRLAAPEDRFVREEAARLRRSRTRVVEELTREAIRTRRYPGIGFRGDDQRRRAWVIGSGLDVWEIVGLLHDFRSEQEVAKEYELTPGQIRIALAYYNEYGAEIDELVEVGRRRPEELATRYPFIQSFEAAAKLAG